VCWAAPLFAVLLLCWLCEHASDSKGSALFWALGCFVVSSQSTLTNSSLCQVRECSHSNNGCSSCASV
jgi:hypothetical protein